MVSSYIILVIHCWEMFLIQVLAAYPAEERGHSESLSHITVQCAWAVWCAQAVWCKVRKKGFPLCFGTQAGCNSGFCTGKWTFLPGKTEGRFLTQQAHLHRGAGTFCMIPIPLSHRTTLSHSSQFQWPCLMFYLTVKPCFMLTPRQLSVPVALSLPQLSAVCLHGSAEIAPQRLIQVTL